MCLIVDQKLSKLNIKVISELNMLTEHIRLLQKMLNIEKEYFIRNKYINEMDKGRSVVLVFCCLNGFHHTFSNVRNKIKNL